MSSSPRYLVLAALVAIAPLASTADEHEGTDYEAGKRAYLASDYDDALRIWRPLADGGDKFAQFSLGSLYFEGAGVERDYAQSAQWFRKAAEQGYAPAQFNLGNAYKHGNGIDQDDLQAAEWWREAAEQDFAPAQFNLGTQYYFGRGVPKDEEAAIRWYRRAAENGHPQAQRLFSMSDTPASEAQASEPATTGEAPATQTAASTTGEATAVATASSVAAASASGELSGEDWLLAQNPQDFTLQLLATRDETLMRKYLGQHQFSQPVAYFGFERDGKRWFAVVYGSYGGKSQAQAAVATLPVTLKERSPWIRQFGGIQKLITSR